MMTKTFRYFTLLLVSLTFLSCEEKKNPEPTVVSVQKPQYAKGFEWRSLSDGSRELVLFDPINFSDTLDKFRFNQKDHHLLGCMSPAHIVFLGRLHHLTDITAVCMANMTGSKYAINTLGKLSLYNLSNEFVETEKIEAGKADILFVDSLYEYYPSESEKIQVRQIRVGHASEPHPLGCLEWIKVFAGIVGEEEKAQRYCDSVFTQYNALAKEVTEKISFRPTMVYGDSYVSEETYKSYWSTILPNQQLTVLLKDAGGTNPFEKYPHDQRIELGKDTLCEILSKIDYFGVSVVNNDIGRIDRQLQYNVGVIQDCDYEGYIKCFSHDLNKSDLFGKGIILEPQKLLEDLRAILHPEHFRSNKTYLAYDGPVKMRGYLFD